MNNNLSNKVFGGMKWKAMERLSLQAINAVTPMILARLLSPADFGSVAILSVFISIANTFVNNGLCNAVIQKKESDNLDSSTVFFTQLGIAVICYLILFFSAPLIAGIYNDANLIPMLRVMSLSLIIGSLYAMQTTMMKKKMEFHKSFIVHGVGTVVYGAVGIGLAYAGAGCWSLVFANLANTTSMMVCSMLTIRWRPMLRFSLNRLKQLFSYSWKLTVGWLIGTLHQDIYALVIGKRFSSAVLGFYNRAGSFPQLISKTITEVVDGVMFPALAEIQDDRVKLKKVTRTMISVNAYILFPLFFGLAAIGDNVISLILTDKWLPAVPMMQIMCITYALNSLNNSNMQVFNAIGRSDLFMKFEMIKRSVSLVLLVVMSFVNIYAVLFVLVSMAILSNGMNIYQDNKLLGYTFKEFMSDLLPSFLEAVFMAVCVWFVGKCNMHKLLEVCVQIVVGITIWMVLSIAFRNRSYQYIRATAINYLFKRKQK